MHKKAHSCNETYCKTCKDFVTPGHKCYMKTINTATENDCMTYIFFDFECTQDTLIQCEKGYESGDSLKCKNCGKAKTALWCKGT